MDIRTDMYFHMERKWHNTSSHCLNDIVDSYFETYDRQDLYVYHIRIFTLPLMVLICRIILDCMHLSNDEMFHVAI